MTILERVNREIEEIERNPKTKEGEYFSFDIARVKADEQLPIRIKTLILDLMEHILVYANLGYYSVSYTFVELIPLENEFIIDRITSFFTRQGFKVKRVEEEKGVKKIIIYWGRGGE